MNQLKNVVVLGAGVVGLTTALTLQERKLYNVTILAETLPTDPKTIRYTSQWAGALHSSFAGDDQPEQTKMERETFDILWKMSAPGGEAERCFMRAKAVMYSPEKYDESKPHPLSWLPEFRHIPKNELPEGTLSGVTFRTVTIDVPNYLNYLLSRFLSKGGEIVRGSVQHVSQVIEGGVTGFTQGSKLPSPPDAVVICTGIQTRFLGGVEDKDVYPIRGQTVLVRAPWVQQIYGKLDQDNSLSYIIPRRSGDVVIGGTKGIDDWYPRARPETTKAILERALKLCPPVFAPPEVLAERKPTLEDIKPRIIEEGCGLRPARKGGIRLGVEWVDCPGESAEKAQKTPVIFNYGHGGSGYEASWGSAAAAARLLKDALESK